MSVRTTTLFLGDFGEAGADREGHDLAVVQVAQLAGLERGHQTRVHRQDAHFTIRSGQIDVVHGVRENLFLGSDDIEVEGHGGRSLKC